MNSLLFSQFATTSYKILGVSVEGNKYADAKTIILNSGLKVGEEIQVPGDATANVVKKLWALNIFSDVQIVIEKQMVDGVFLLIKVTEYPRIEKVELNGNDEINDKDIENIVNLVRGQILKPQEVERIKQRILKKYEEEGYLNAEVTPQYFEYFTADTTEDEILVQDAVDVLVMRTR